MKFLFFSINLILLSIGICHAQKQGQARIDSLLAQLPKAQEDTNKIKLLDFLTETYARINPAEGLKYGEQGLALAKKTGWKKGEALVSNAMAANYSYKGNYAIALEYYRKALEISEDINNKTLIAANTGNIGNIYLYKGVYDTALSYYFKALKLNRDLPDSKIKDHSVANTTGNVGNVYYYEGDYPHALEYWIKAVTLELANGDQGGAALFISNIGGVYYSQSNYPLALEYWFKGLKIDEAIGDKQGIARTTGNIGIVYNEQEDFPHALEYYIKALKIKEMLGDKREIAATTENIGLAYENEYDYPHALEYYFKALQENQEIGNKHEIGDITGNIGSVFSLQGDSRAMDYFLNALKIQQEIGNKEGIAISTAGMGKLYLQMAQDSFATPGDKSQWLHQSIRLLDTAVTALKDMGDLKFYEEESENLSKAYALSGQYAKALAAFQEHSLYKDSVFNMEKSKELTRKELTYVYGKKQDSLKLEDEKKQLAYQKEIELNALRYEYEKKQALAKTEKEKEQLRFEEAFKQQQIENDFRQKQEAAKAAQDKKDALSQAELKREKNIRNASFAGGGLLAIIALLATFAYRQKKKDNKIITIEKQRSESLLLNILPVEVAEELKENGEALAKQFDDITVMFTDFVDFTAMSERLRPQELVNELHACFKAFDTIIERNGLEKIKTIGDAYMAVCGLPASNLRHAQNTVTAAQEIIAFMQDRRRQYKDTFEIRIGLNTGSVVAGIVGIKKFAYDIWGDTVNIAARMESSGEAGRINISDSTYRLVRDEVACEYRGKISAKHKGEIDMYFVNN